MAKTATQTKPAFAAILDRPSGDIDRPSAAPPGEYVCVVQGQPRFDKSSKKQTEFVEFILKVLEAMDTVDEEALETFLTKKDGTKKPLGETTFRATYYLTESSTYRLVDFLDHCEAGEEDMSLRQRIAEAPGKQIVVSIKHEASDDGTTVYAKIGSTAAV